MWGSEQGYQAPLLGLNDQASLIAPFPGVFLLVESDDEKKCYDRRLSPSFPFLFAFPFHPTAPTLANFFKSLIQQARSIAKFSPESLLPSRPVWTKQTGVQAGRFDRRADKMDSTPESKSDKQDKQERSYLSAAVESMTWGSSRPSATKSASAGLPGEGSGLKNQHGGYQSTHQWHGLSSKRYPGDCPALNARWFYAVDVGYKHFSLSIID